MKKWLFILLISFFVFMPKDVFAYSNNFTTSLLDTPNNPRLNLATGWIYEPSGTWGVLYFDGDIVFDESELNGNTRQALFFNYNFCTTSPNVIEASGHNNANNVYVNNSGTSCSVRGMEGHVVQLFFMTYVWNDSFGFNNFTYEGSVQMTFTPPYYLELMNYSVAINSTFNIVGSTDAKLDKIYSALFGEDSIKGSIDKNTEEQEKTNEKLDDLKDSITDSDTSEANDSAGGFFTDFEDDDYGLSDIVTLPLTFIQGLANASCSELSLPLPFVDEDVELPCMSAIYEDYFGPFLTIYQIITFGIVGYWVCVNTLRLVNNFKNPDNDEVEVMDL